ncbi:hypothetical protein O181_087112 [Austropuccinia psidii MF-1]|uniref:Uncharacterized protein n=1 Tax=Austropuccinia psidii MF-1 TaxID=1389203 RepID=A0A9Q3IP25_9BASI|nr:hypothetical protein [Austropuccinia psidii MF-1]
MFQNFPGSKKQVVVKIIQNVSYLTTNPDAEGSDELDGEGVELLNEYTGKFTKSSPTQLPVKNLKRKIIPSTPRKIQPFIPSIPSSIPSPSQNPSTATPSLASPISPPPIPHPRTSPMIAYQKLQPADSTT